MFQTDPQIIVNIFFYLTQKRSWTKQNQEVMELNVCLLSVFFLFHKQTSLFHISNRPRDRSES